jgi:hypothetical protein
VGGGMSQVAVKAAVRMKLDGWMNARCKVEPYLDISLNLEHMQLWEQFFLWMKSNVWLFGKEKKSPKCTLYSIKQEFSTNHLKNELEV